MSLKSLFRADKQQPSEQEVAKRDPTKAFIKHLDKSFDQKIRSTADLSRIERGGARPELRATLQEDVPERLLQRKTQEARRTIEEEMIKKKFELDAEAIRRENLQQARQDAASRRSKQQEFEDREIKKMGQNGSEHLLKSGHGASAKHIHYNPLDPEPTPKARNNPKLNPNDPANDPRWQFNLSVTEPSSKPNIRPPTKPTYNPLEASAGTSGPNFSHGDNDLNIHQQPRQPPPSKVMSSEQLRQLEELRADPYLKVVRQAPIEATTSNCTGPST